MFIANREMTEIINVNSILAVHTQKALRQITIHTDNRIVYFRVDTAEELEEYERQIEMSLYSATNRWAACQNWFFRADKISGANILDHDGLTVYINGKAYLVPRRGEDRKEALMEEFSKSLSYPLMADKGPNLVIIK